MQGNSLYVLYNGWLVIHMPLKVFAKLLGIHMHVCILSVALHEMVPMFIMLHAAFHPSKFHQINLLPPQKESSQE